MRFGMPSFFFCTLRWAKKEARRAKAELAFFERKKKEEN